jgi:hypothetical protein
MQAASMAGPRQCSISYLSLIQINLRGFITRGRRELLPTDPISPRLMLDAQELVNTMKKSLLATVAIVAFSVPSFAAETAKTVGQSSLSFYLAQDTATLKCQIVETQPVAGSSVKVVGAAHSTKALAETALQADKTCAKPLEVSKNERIRL